MEISIEQQKKNVECEIEFARQQLTNAQSFIRSLRDVTLPKLDTQILDYCINILNDAKVNERELTRKEREEVEEMMREQSNINAIIEALNMMDDLEDLGNDYL